MDTSTRRYLQIADGGHFVLTSQEGTSFALLWKPSSAGLSVFAPGCCLNGIYNCVETPTPSFTNESRRGKGPGALSVAAVSVSTSVYGPTERINARFNQAMIRF